MGTMNNTTEKRESFGEIIKGNTPVLVDFHAVWCGPCKMMPPVLQELHEKMGDSIRILKIDIDKNPQVAQAFNVQAVPTLMLFKNGNVVWRQAGVVPAHELAAVVKPHV